MHLVWGKNKLWGENSWGKMVGGKLRGDFNQFEPKFGGKTAGGKWLGGFQL